MTGGEGKELKIGEKIEVVCRLVIGAHTKSKLLNFFELRGKRRTRWRVPDRRAV